MWLIKYVPKLGGLSSHPSQNYIFYNWDFKNVVQDYSAKILWRETKKQVLRKARVYVIREYKSQRQWMTTRKQYLPDTAGSWVAVQENLTLTPVYELTSVVTACTRIAQFKSDQILARRWEVSGKIYPSLWSS